MSAAEKLAAGLEAVAEHAAAAVVTDGRELVSGALETVAGVNGTRRVDLEGHLIVVSADLTNSHHALLR